MSRRGTAGSSAGRRLADLTGSAVVPALALVVVLGLDLVRSAWPWPVPVAGLLDEPGHLLTAWIVLTALRPTWGRTWSWALVGAVAIDVDHVPLYLWHFPVSAQGGRPVTHSLLTVVVAGTLALAVRRWRVVAGGLALGLLLHFARDVATSTGLPLLWPALDTNVLVPYWTYVLTLSAATAVAVGRRGTAPRGGPLPRTAAPVLTPTDRDDRSG